MFKQDVHFLLFPHRDTRESAHLDPENSAYCFAAMDCAQKARCALFEWLRTLLEEVRILLEEVPTFYRSQGATSRFKNPGMLVPWWPPRFSPLTMSGDQGTWTSRR